MKKMRKILPAIVMLLISAVMMSTASFAWFAMNTNVTATGMSVSAKSNDTFLQIKPKGGEVDGPGIQATASVPAASLYPAKYDSVNKKFQYSYSNDQASSASSGVYYDVVNLNDYVLTNEFTILMKDSDADAVTKNLRVSGFTVTCAEADMLNAIRIVVTCGDNVQTLSAEGKTSGNANSVDKASATVLVDTVTEGGVDVKVQVYIDGDYTTVFSNNAAKLINASVSIAFNTEQPTA